MNLDEVISTTYGPRLTTVGFEQVRPRKWVRDRGIGIREIFQIQSIRTRYSARWGFSMDLVPLYRNGRFHWKRTSKTCDFDLCIDPIDESGTVPEWCSFVHAAGHQECNPADLSEIESGTWRRASLDFDRIHAISDVCDLLEERSHLKFRRFSLENYVQTHLAWGIALHVRARDAEGDRHLDAFCRRHDVDRKDPFLLKAIDAARQRP
jgi:hypothetical protein